MRLLWERLALNGTRKYFVFEEKEKEKEKIPGFHQLPRKLE